MDDESIWRFRIYPVRLVLPDREGVALWGGNFDDGSDVFLTQGEGKVMLAGSLSELADRLPGEGDGPLTRTADFDRFTAEFTELVRTGSGAEDINEIAFQRGREVLKPGVREPGGGAGFAVDGIDTIRDLAIQLNDAEMLRSLRTGGEVLHQLYFYLWGDVDAIEWSRARAAFDQAVTWFGSKLE
ncbi:hypothetical protein ACQPZJ_41230 [Actinoplanes sp. CA-054009]